ncbi:hypothetical protein EDD22DRAFT_844825 [Suillus occidentalis]|nr:hypothetical protein EDD22DRAFT_844825 [Suillus occidentalis]
MQYGPNEIGIVVGLNQRMGQNLLHKSKVWLYQHMHAYFPLMPSINMLEDNILVKIDGVTSLWDTYCLNLNIVTPGSKQVIFWFKDIERMIQQGSEHINVENQPSSTVVTEVKIKTNVETHSWLGL